MSFAIWNLAQMVQILKNEKMFLFKSKKKWEFDIDFLRGSSPKLFVSLTGEKNLTLAANLEEIHRWLGLSYKSKIYIL